MSDTSPTKLMHKRHVTDHKEYFKTEKAYRSAAFMNSRAARPIRVLAELTEFEQRCEHLRINNTIVFFGSARAKSPEKFAKHWDEAQAALAAAAPGSPELEAAQAAVARLERAKWMTDLWPSVQLLSEKLTRWSMQKVKPGTPPPYVICTGGGPGFMEAANRGSAAVPDATSLGISVSLPFEAGLNKYVSPEGAFECHYFFTRKFAMTYTGTVDELAEIMCLRQTKKIKESRMPIVLMGKEYWSKVVNFQYMADMGTISQADADHLFITDDVDAAFEHITSALTAIESDRAGDEVGYKHRMIGSAGGVPLTKWDRSPAAAGPEQVKFVGADDESVATPSDDGVEEQ